MSAQFHSPRVVAGRTGTKLPGTSILPKIPDHGPAAQLSTRVLLSKIQESSVGEEYMKPTAWDADTSEREQRKQRALPYKVKNESSGHNQDGLNFMNKLRTMLYQKDHLAQPSQLDTVLLPGVDDEKEQNQKAQSQVASLGGTLDSQWDLPDGISQMTSHEASAKSLASAKSMFSRGSVATSRKSLPGVEGSAVSSGQRSSLTAKGAARQSGFDLLAPLEGVSPTVLGGKRATLLSSGAGHLTGQSMQARQECLRTAFVRTQQDIQKKLAEVDDHITIMIREGRIDAPMSGESRERHGSKQGSTYQSGYNSGNAAPLIDMIGMNGEKRTDPWMANFFNSFERSSLNAIPPKSITHDKSSMIAKDEQGTPSAMAMREEISQCGCLLNLYRWLCGLNPVQEDPDCEKVCDILSQTLQPRAPLYLKPGSAQFNQLMGFANTTIEYMQDGRVMMLHGEASLVSAMGQCVSTCHTINAEEAFVRPKRDARESLENVRKRAEQSRSRTPEPMVHSSGMTTLFEKTRLSLQNLPDQLEEFRIFWEVAAEGEDSKNGADANNDDPGAIAGGSAMSKLFSSKQLLGGRPATSESRRSVKSLQRGIAPTRKVPWFNGRPLSERGMAEEHGQFWGDQDGTIDFRRYLLNPDLKAFAAVRRQDTCAIWTGSSLSQPPKQNIAPPEDPLKPAKKRDSEPTISARQSLLKPRASQSGASTPEEPAEDWNPQSSMRQKSDDIPEIVCFPPPGLFPLEYLFDTVPTWSVMPDCRYYQPTEKLEVGMWKVRIENGRADRLEEVKILCLSTDCSHRGNPFCIIFRPDLPRLEDGDCFEVHVKGLRSDTRPQEFFFFHQFQYFKQNDHDAHFVAEVRKLVRAIDSPSLWQEPNVTVPALDQGGGDEKPAGFKGGLIQPEKDAAPGQRGSVLSSNPQGGLPFKGHDESLNKSGTSTKKKAVKKQDLGSNPSAQSKDKDESKPKSTRVMLQSKDSDMPVIGLVSHPETTFQSESVDVTMSVYAPQACAMRCQLFLTRVTSRDEIKRCCQVQRIGDNFVIRLKLPMAHCKYELTFKVSTWKNPGYWIDHPLKYYIQSAENCQNLIFSAEHPLVHKFGFAMLQHTCQMYDVVLITPVMHRVRAGRAYFLFYINPKCQRHPKEQQPPPGEPLPPSTNTDLFTQRLAVEAGANSLSQSGMVKSGELNLTDKSSRGSFRGSFRGSISKGTPNRSSFNGFGAGPLGSKSPTRGGENVPTVDVINCLNEQLCEGLQHVVQDATGSIHVDLCIAENRQVLRLKQRTDFPEFHEALITIPNAYIGCKIEMFLRFRKAIPKSYAPIKLAEFLVIRRNEMFPNGF